MLDAIVGRGAYETSLIEGNEDLLARYAHRIPVLALDGNDRLEGLITGPDVRELVRELADDDVSEDAPPR